MADNLEAYDETQLQWSHHSWNKLGRTATLSDSSENYVTV